MTAMQLAAPAAQPYLGGLCGRGVVASIADTAGSTGGSGGRGVCPWSP